MAGERHRRWRIGTAPYLGARPLDCGLADHPAVDLVTDVPSRLAERLDADELDAALLPVIDYFRLTADALERHRHRPLAIVPGIAVTSRGPSNGVLLACRVDRAVVRHVALDPAGHTSNCLVRLILKEVYGRKPHFRWPVPDPGEPDLESDAVLLVGDRALVHDESDSYQTIDLGEAWDRHAGLPFVYAVWAVRESDGAGDVAAIVHEAKARGLAARDELARAGAARLGIAEDRARAYLRENMRYDLGPDEVAGLQKFYRWAASEELAPLNIPIRLVGPAAGDA